LLFLSRQRTLRREKEADNFKSFRAAGEHSDDEIERAVNEPGFPPLVKPKKIEIRGVIMELTQEQKDALLADFLEKTKDVNKADIGEIKTLIVEKLGRIDNVETLSKELAEKLKGIKTKSDPDSWKAKRPAFSGMETNSEDLPPIMFEDDAGVEHKAYRSGEKLEEKSDEDFSVGKIIRAKILGNLQGLNDFEIKAAGEGIGSLGGWLIGEEISTRIIDLARNLAAVQKAGAITMPMASPEMRIVAVKNDPTAMWVAEHGEITESEFGLAPINLKAMTLGVLVRSSIELLEDAPNAGNQIQNAMAAALSLEMDRVALLGDGATEPRGLDHCDDINKISMGANGAAPTNYDQFSNACEDVEDHNGKAGAVIFSPRTFYTLDRLKAATTNQPLIPPQSFQDLQKFSTNQIGNTDTKGTCSTCSKAFVGDFKNVLYGIRKSLEVEISKTAGQKTFAQCEALIRCRMRLDIAVLRENHFTRIEGLKA